MKKIGSVLAAIVLIGTAVGQDAISYPAWQLVAAESGKPALVTWQLPEAIDLQSITDVQITGASVAGFGIMPQDGILEVHVLGSSGEPLLLEEVSIVAGGTKHLLAVPPTEVHWPAGANDGALIVRSSLREGSRSHVMALLLENTSTAQVEVTGFRYAPAAVSTGEVLLATDFGHLDHLFDTKLPYLHHQSLTDAGRPSEPTWNPDTWEGIPFDYFTFDSGNLSLAPSEQAILVLAAPGFLTPDLFNFQELLTFGPWIEYLQDEEAYWFQPFVTRISVQH